ncbi:capsular biosynthesis protein [Clostridium perfringens]|nr:capsular biosynthesis protein [Clostridium perfringens]
MRLKNSILKIFSANFLSMISSLVIGFIVPTVLSVNEYAHLKTYTFYISYITIFHLGFIDGMYIKYGGKTLSEIDKSELKLEHIICLITQSVISFIFIVISIITKDLIIFFMAISIIPVNMISFHKQFYQAVGEFKKYVNILNVYTVFNLIFNIVLAIILRLDNYKYYCIVSIISNIIVYIYSEVKYYKVFRNISTSYNSKVWNNIKIGFFILIGNLSVSLLYGLDRWFVKIFYSSVDFAYYSFAISMLSLINTLISAITITFYNYIAKYENKELINKVKKYLIIIGAISSLGYFGFSAIINIVLNKYMPSLDIIAILFSAYPYMILINALFVNLYKIRKDEKKYLKVVVLMLLISVVYNVFALFISDNPTSIAFATTLGFITWYIYSSKDFKYLKPNKNEILFLLINFVAFLITSHMKMWFVGGIVYFIILLVSIKLCFDSIFKEICKYLCIKVNL